MGLSGLRDRLEFCKNTETAVDRERGSDGVLKMPWFQTATHVDSQTWVSECIHDPTTRQLEIANPVRPCNKSTNAVEASLSVTGPLGSQQRRKHFSLLHTNLIYTMHHVLQLQCIV